MKESQIRTKFISHGRWQITVSLPDGREISWSTTDSMLVDDIDEFNNDGFEENLQNHSSFEELVIDMVLNAEHYFNISANGINTNKVNN